MMSGEISDIKIKEVIRNIWTFTLRVGYKFIPYRLSPPIAEEDWDWLIVLDACRYDDFREVNFIEGELKPYISRGSATPEWFRNNFYEEHKDIVYYNANPVVAREIKKSGFNPFYKIFHIWKYGWNDEFNTVLPRTVNMVVLETKNKFKDKRKIIHYIQPHCPFLSLSIKRDETFKDVFEDFTIIDRTRRMLFFYGNGVWKKLRTGKIDNYKGRNAYRKNIEIVLKRVQELISHLDGKIVITADHGNLFGEYFIYAHPVGLRIKKLVEVPWLEVKK